jgi:hypothetical protein
MSTNISSTEQIVEINAGDQITNVNIVSQSTTQVISGEQVVTVDVNAGTIPAAWGTITGTLSNQTDLQNALNSKQNNITLTTTGTSGAATLIGATLNIPNYTDTGLTSVGLSVPTGLTVSNSPLTSNGTIAVAYASGYSIPTNAKQAQWDQAYNDKINSAEVSGTTTKTLTLTQQDGGIIQASWSDIDTAPVTSVFGRTGDVVAAEGDYNLNQLGDVTITTATNGQVLKYNGTAWVNAADASGLTSVGVSMPSAFNVSGSPLTSNGTIAITGAGTTSQYIRGDGSLATFPSVASEAKTLIREVYNKTGETLAKGTVVYINGGQGNLPTVTKAIATTDESSAQTFGFVQSDITNMNNGFVVVAGGIDNLNTQAYPEGTALYLSPTTAGLWTSTKPYAPNHIVYLGTIVRSHPTQGVIEVNISNGWELDELHNVSARFPSNKDGLFYNSTNSIWENKSIEGVLGYTPVPNSRVITINGTAQDLSTDRTYNVGTVTSVNATVPTGFEVSGVPITSTGTIDIKFASGYSLPTDAKQTQWDTAYTKRIDTLNVTGNSGSASLVSNILNIPTYTLTGLGGEPAITAGTSLQYFRGDKTFQTLDTSVVPENGPVYFTEPRVRQTVLSGLNVTGGSIVATDNVLNAFGKIQNQINGLIGGSIFQSTWNASTNTPSLASGVGTKGYYYIVSVAGTTNLDGITDWQIGDWAIFDGTVWRKVDNTDAVVSVNGYTGVVNLVLDDLADVSAASPTDTQLLRFNGTTSKWYNWTPNYEPALTKGNLTEATSSVLTITGGSNAVIGSGTTIQVKQSSATGSGFLSSTDWTTFNNKQNALTNPVTGTGTNNYVAKFNATGSTIANSQIFDDGTSVSVGSTVISSKFTVYGGTSSAGSSTSSSAYTIAANDPTSMAAGVGGSLLFQGYKTGTSSIGNFAYIAGKKENATAGNEAGNIVMGTFNSGGTPSENFRIKSTGQTTITNVEKTNSTQTVLELIGYNATPESKGLYFNLVSGTPLWVIRTGATGTDAGIRIAPDGTNGLNIAYSGDSSFTYKLGVGITPSKKLDIYDDASGGTDDIVRVQQGLAANHAWYRSQRNGGANMVIGATRNNVDVNVPANSSIVWNQTGSDMAFGTDNALRFTLTSGGTFNYTASVTAASAIARGFHVQPTLVASANGDSLVGLDIRPSYNLGAYGSTQRIPFRAQLADNRWIEYNENIYTIKFNDNANVLPLVIENAYGGGFAVGVDFKLGYGGSGSSVGTSVSAGRIYVSPEGSWSSTASTQDASMIFYTVADGVMGAGLSITSGKTIKFDGYSTNGFVKTSSSNGTITIDTTSYQPLLTNPVTGTGNGVAGQVAYFTGNNSIDGTSAFSWSSPQATIGISDSGNNTDYSLRIIRHGTLANPGTWTTTSSRALLIQDFSTDGGSSFDPSGLVSIELPRVASSDTNAGNIIAFRVANDTLVGLAVNGKGNTFLGQSGSTDTGERLQVSGSGKFSSTLTSVGLTSTSTINLGGGTTGVTSPDLYIDATSASSKVYIGRLSTTDNDNTEFYVRDRAGQVAMFVSTSALQTAIGSSTRISRLTVTGSTTADTARIVINDRFNSGATSFGYDFYRTYDTGGNDQLAGYIRINRTGGDANGGMSFGVGDRSLVSERINIGNTGIIKISTNNVALVQTNAAGTGTIGIARVTSGNNLQIGDGGTANPTNIYFPNGNVGINTTTVNAKLQINDSTVSSGGSAIHAYGFDGAANFYTTRGESPANTAIYLYNNPSAGQGYGTGISFRAKSSTTDSRSQADIYTTWTTATDATRTAKLVFTTVDSGVNSTKMTLLGNGHLGVGQETPSGRLHVTMTGISASNPSLGWPVYNAEADTNARSIYVDTAGNSNTSTAGQGATVVLQLGQYYDSRVVITPTGAGGASPSDQGSGRGKDMMIKAGTSDNGAGYKGGRLYLNGGMGYQSAYNANGGEIIMQALTGSGNVLIGTSTNNTGKLQVSGSIYATSFFESSDIRLKNVIEKNPKSNLKLDVLKFTRKVGDDKDQVRFGYSAQQVKELMPELVGGKEYLSVNYIDVHTLKIASLEEEIKQLKNKLNELGR